MYLNLRPTRGFRLVGFGGDGWRLPFYLRSFRCKKSYIYDEIVGFLSYFWACRLTRLFIPNSDYERKWTILSIRNLCTYSFLLPIVLGTRHLRIVTSWGSLLARYVSFC